jgi:coproporphyrinogen III oxidase
VEPFFSTFPERLCAALEGFEPHARFRADTWQREEGGGGISRILEGGDTFERAAVLFSRVSGSQLPPSSTARRPELAGRAYEVIGCSVVIHPRNPYAPTSHMNVRCFVAGDIYWFGGGFDLTPYYGFVDDAQLFHREAQAAVGAHYPAFKQWCDEYFYLKHRGEARGIGGIFFDDLANDFTTDFALVQRVAEHFQRAYTQIVARRYGMPYGDRERAFQLVRRGRYVEFNLVFDRGTLFGLQSGGRVESILGSLPPLAAWQYDYQPVPGSPEAELREKFLTPREWI